MFLVLLTPSLRSVSLRPEQIDSLYGVSQVWNNDAAADYQRDIQSVEQFLSFQPASTHWKRW
jgi:hypothetical protein